MPIQILKTEAVGAAKVVARYNGSKFSVRIIENGQSREASDWTDMKSAIYVFKFVVVALRGKTVKK